jgi:hypothetical protein
MPDDQPFGPIDEEEEKILPDGSKYPTSKTEYTVDESGKLIRRKILYTTPDAYCESQFNLHGYAPLTRGHDAYITANGKILCKQCFKKNNLNKLLKWLFYPFYKPEIY